MADAKIVESLMDHFGRAWDMIIEAAKRFPAEQWFEAQDERMQPARIAVHILMGAERYTWTELPDDYVSRRKLAVDWIQAPAREFPSQQDAVVLLEAAKAKTLEWVRQYGPDRLVCDKPAWPWTGCSVLAQALYHLRHLQHHLAELNVELRRRGLAIVEWK